MELQFSVDLDTKPLVQFTGVIDRLDVDDSGGVIVREFKSGTQWKDEVRKRAHTIHFMHDSKLCGLLTVRPVGTTMMRVAQGLHGASLLQPKLYSLAVQRMYGTLPKRVEIEAIETGEIRVLVPTHAHLRAVEASVAKTAASIAAQRYEPTPSHAMCRVCPFRLACPASVVQTAE
jgi:CRISPR/Cas system-associated exonuclease Cas4 (RecB family)